MEIYNGYKRLARNYTLMTDAYEYTMASAYFANGMKDKIAVFDLFFRRIPNNGGYAIMAGLDKVISYIKDLKFDDNMLECFKRNGYDQAFIDYLKDFKFSGNIYAIPDGTPVFPNEPLITVEAPIIDAVIIETALLSIVNGAMEHATGARRIIESTPSNVKVMEFGARRADGMEAAIDSSIYGIMAGCAGTSNVMASDMLNKKAMGTMAHSWIETFPSEYEAFRAYSKVYPDNCILLVDTIDTLRSGVPNAIKVFKEMRDNGVSTSNIGIRIDSGDLAYLSREARRMFDEAGFLEAKICLSNGLNAETIESLIKQGACFDTLGVGDNISKPSGRMGCVYKEVALINDGKIVPKMKLSNDPIKIVNPGYKNLYRLYDNETGFAIADVITNKNESIDNDNLMIVSLTDYLKRKKISNYNYVLLQKPIFINGELVYDDPSIDEKRDYCNKEMLKIYPEVKRLENPQEYYVDGTINYVTFKNDMILKLRESVVSDYE